MEESPRLEALRRRVLADPASVAFAALAEEFRRAGRLDEAVDTAQAGLVRHPGYTSARVTLGRALLDSGSIAAARQELEQALASAPENLAALRALADLYRTTGVPGRALELALRGAALAPQDREWRQLVQALEYAGSSRRAAPPVILQPPSPPSAPPAPTLAPPSIDVPPTAEVLDTAWSPDPLLGLQATFAQESAVASRLLRSAPPTESPALEPLEAWLSGILRERQRRAELTSA